MKDIILVLSDQHSQAATCFRQPWLDTDNMRRIAEEGASFSHAYCNAPLCVPSRMSFLCGQYPHETMIYNNDATLSGDIPTIAHAIGAAGYHTVLVGRMHFKGEEQHHGFDERLVGDITSQYWGTGGNNRSDMGDYLGSTNMKGCRRVVGAGYSPVMAYDDMVVEAALECLRRPHTEPLFMVVGLYSPHFPYVAEQQLYDKYRERIPTGGQEPPPRECYLGMVQQEVPERAQHIRAAYCGMVERLDRQVGTLYDSWQEFSHSRGEQGIFVYTSDHGEQCGKRGLFGKQTLYEDAVGVPLIVSGGTVVNRQIDDTVSLLDLSITLVELAGGTMPHHSGHSLTALLDGGKLPQRPVLIQHMLESGELPTLLQAAVRYPYKLVREHGRDCLFDLQADPEETIDLYSILPEVAQQLAQVMLPQNITEQCEADNSRQRLRQGILKAWGRARKPAEPATIKIPDNARSAPIE